MKRGYTLLELVISLGLCGLIVTAMLPILLRYNSTYKSETLKSQDHFYAEEALMFIDKTISECKHVSVSGNYIELSYENTNIKKYIGLNGSGDIVITHVEFGVNSTPNNILNNISGYSVLQKESTIYVSITVSSGERYERCIGIKLES